MPTGARRRWGLHPGSPVGSPRRYGSGWLHLRQLLDEWPLHFRRRLDYGQGRRSGVADTIEKAEIERTTDERKIAMSVPR